MSKSQLTVWDFRYNADSFEDYKEVIETLKGVAKHYVFQLEEGDTGYRHYQGRLSLIKKRRYSEKHLILNLFKGKPPNYFEPTVAPEALRGDAFYQCKEDTRLSGPWSDKDPVQVETKQLNLFKKCELYPWQQRMLAESETFDMRKIDLIYDPEGNIGKSIFLEYMEYLGNCEEIPPFRMMDDIFQWVCSRPTKSVYVIDMPRGIRKDNLADMYAGIEVIKNGVAYDKRYNAKKIRFDRPRIFVFTNKLPKLRLLSMDRWNLWEVDRKTMELNVLIRTYGEPILKNTIIDDESDELCQFPN